MSRPLHLALGAALALAAALGSMVALADDYPEPAGAHLRRLWTRLRGRYFGSRDRSEDGQDPGPAVRRRDAAGWWQQHRGRAGYPCVQGRVHAGDGKRRQRRERRPWLAPLRLRQGPGAGCAVDRGADHVGGAPSLGARNLKELIAIAKEKPGQIRLRGSSGVGTAGHLGGALINVMADIKLVHVPYPGSAQALTDLLRRPHSARCQRRPRPSIPQVAAGELDGIGMAQPQAVRPRRPTCRRSRSRG